MFCVFYFFFFQAEDGIRDGRVTGVQTCALPISPQRGRDHRRDQVRLRPHPRGRGEDAARGALARAVIPGDRAHDAARRPHAAARIPGSRRRVHRRRRARVAAGARRTGPRRCGGRVLRAHGLQRGAGRAAVRSRAHARPAAEDARRAAQQPRRHADGGCCRRPLLRSPRVRGRSGGRGARARRHRGGAAPDRLLLPGARAPAAARCAARAPRGARGRERLQSGVRARGIAPHSDEHGDAALRADRGGSAARRDAPCGARSRARIRARRARPRAGGGLRGVERALDRGARLLDWLQSPPDGGPRGRGAAMAEPERLKLGSRPLRLGELRRVYAGPLSVAIDAAALGAVREAHAVTARLAAGDAPVYGINTGFGLLANTRIAPAQRTLLQRNIILSHSAGVGPLLDDTIVRLTLVLKLASLLQGFSGVSVELVRFLERLINSGLTPCVPAQGSVGASGDLAPLAHLSLAVLGLGEIRRHGEVLPAAEALAQEGLTPLALGPKEGLALLNGTQVSTALALAGLFELETVFAAAVVSGAMSLDALQGSDAPFDALIDPKLSGLPPFLTPDSGVNSGFMMAQVTAAALVAENRMLCHPASVDSIPTSANQEDHVSMATHGARRLLAMTGNALNVVALEFLAACQGLDFRAPLKTSARLAGAHGALRLRVPFAQSDRLLAPDIAEAALVVRRSEVQSLVSSVLPSFR